ncbi:MAG TPA: diacylglycerol kinase family protein [Chthoniobacterales bacterium]|nr:diacylglycerol kinase family protein [Chthoniobacterales bacterium]
MKTCIICNPGAGSVDNGAATLEQLRSADRSATVRLTRDIGQATEFAHQAAEDGYELVVAAGGDGTLNEVVNGVAPHIDRIRVGLIPLGTGNDFARSLNLPDSVEACVDVLREQHVKPVDLVRVTNGRVRYMLNVSAGGFSGAVGEKLTPEIKKSWGPLAYLRCAAEAFPELRAYRTSIVLDDMTPLEFNLYNAIVANGRFVAGGTQVAPEAAIDDGQLDLVLVPERPMSEMVVMAAQMLVGNHLTSDAVVFRRAAKVSISSSPGMWFNVDGELIGNEPVTFEVMPRALQFIAPNES